MNAAKQTVLGYLNNSIEYVRELQIKRATETALVSDQWVVMIHGFPCALEDGCLKMGQVKFGKFALFNRREAYELAKRFGLQWVHIDAMLEDAMNRLEKMVDDLK
jgi:hypothetical protein